MKYTNEINRIHSLSINLKQVNKTTARKLFNEGGTIYLHPCNMTLNNPWMSPAKYENNDNYTFEELLNTWSYYNSSSELGKYANYFIEA